jgi:omega-amidase
METISYVMKTPPNIGVSRAVDNQVYVSMCSPTRDMSARYHAVRTRNDVRIPLTIDQQWGHSMVVDPM